MTGVELTTVEADVPLDNMFGFSNELRSATQARTSVRPRGEERRNKNNKHRKHNNLMRSYDVTTGEGRVLNGVPEAHDVHAREAGGDHRQV